jgi:hypothetical protein
MTITPPSALTHNSGAAPGPDPVGTNEKSGEHARVCTRPRSLRCRIGGRA